MVVNWIREVDLPNVFCILSHLTITTTNEIGFNMVLIIHTCKQRPTESLSNLSTVTQKVNYRS